MATSLAFHLTFAVFGFGLPVMMLIAEGLHLRTGDPAWLALARRWSKAFAILFAVGAVSGTIISFELGLLKHRAIDVFEGRYELKPAKRGRGPPRTQLRYTALIGLCLPPPPAIGSLAVRQNLAAQLEAVAQEVARRTSVPRPKSRTR